MSIVNQFILLSVSPRGYEPVSQLASLASFNPFRARSFLPATVPFHVWPICCSPVPPAAGVFLPGRRQQHVGPGERSRVENSLILQRSADSSSLVLRRRSSNRLCKYTQQHTQISYFMLTFLRCWCYSDSASFKLRFWLPNYFTSRRSAFACQLRAFHRLLPMHWTVYCTLYMLTAATGRFAASG
jgi:hypothetical protein